MQKIFLNEQEFTKLRKLGGVYVDKTRQIYELFDYSRYIFLSRPRRFGKSLLVSTLEALFLGQKELFKGFWIEKNWEWEEYPVIRLDFSDLVMEANLESTNEYLNLTFEKYARKYEVEVMGTHPVNRFRFLLEALYEKTGKGVVILIDEYDNPITSHLSDVKLAERNRDYFRNIYQIIKSKSKFIHFVFITGISKFAKMSIFSAISQMKDISLVPKFNDIVGFTEQELKDNLSGHLQKFGEANNMKETAVMEHITKWYDGYNWSGEEHLFNPYAILNVLADQQIKPYWFETGTPTFLIHLILKDQSFKLEDGPILQQIEELTAAPETFDSYDLENIDITAALFQSGYLTIKKVKTRRGLINYHLGFPNYEVRHAFNAHLLKILIKRDIAADIKGRSIALLEVLEAQDKNKFQKIITSIFSGIPSRILKQLTEYSYQTMFYQLLLLLGVNDIFLEVEGYIGRADGVLILDEHVFIFEFKFSRKSSMEYLLSKAAEQADLKGYWHPYLSTDKKIFRVSVGFLYKKTEESKEQPVLTIDSDWQRINSEKDYPLNNN